MLPPILPPHTSAIKASGSPLPVTSSRHSNYEHSLETAKPEAYKLHDHFEEPFCSDASDTNALEEFTLVDEVCEPNGLDQAAPDSLQEIFDKGLVWRACDQQNREESLGFVNSGFSELDEHLHGGAWPSGEGLELLSDLQGSEGFIILPVIKALTKEGYAVALINPPFKLLPEALLLQGIDTANLYLIETQDPSELVYASSECARSGYFAATIAWEYFERSSLNSTQLRKTYLAAGDSKGLFFLCRHKRKKMHPSPARFRALLGFNADGLELSIFKQRGLKAPIAISLPVASEISNHTPINQRLKKPTSANTIFDLESHSRKNHSKRLYKNNAQLAENSEENFSDKKPAVIVPFKSNLPL